MSRRVIREQSSPKGFFTGRQVVELADGRVVPVTSSPIIYDRLAERAAREVGHKLQTGIEKQNLVVAVGRDGLARMLAGSGNRIWIDRVQLGDAKIGGIVSKDTYPPDLSDNALVNEIRTIGGAPGGTFALDGYTFPSQVTKVQPAGVPATLTSGTVSILTDLTSNFLTDGVNDDDVVTTFIGGEDYVLAVRDVISATQLEVENPGQLSAAGIGYKVTTPGGQVLFSKLVSGNNFPEASYGPITVAHEAGLLYTDGTLFNRVIFAPGSPNVGLLFQPADIDGITLSVQLDWLITF